MTRTHGYKAQVLDDVLVYPHRSGLIDSESGLHNTWLAAFMLDMITIHTSRRVYVALSAVTWQDIGLV